MVRLGQTVGKGTKQASLLALSLSPLAVCVVLMSPAQAATTNSEASSPQRAAPSVSRPIQLSQRATTPAPKPVLPTARSGGTAANDGRPDQNWGGQRAPNAGASSPRQQVRQVNVPVLGREGPAAARTIVPTVPAATAAARRISITASEPALTSIVRPQDVASFQKIGAPYQVAGTWYVPAHEPNYDETGVASWYGSQFQGRSTANGEIFDMNVVSGAHPTLPIPSLVEVTNLSNGRSVVVRINDRGPFTGGRLIDLSSRGAELLGFKQQGHTNVRVRYVGPANSEPVVTAQNISTGQAYAAAVPVSAQSGPSFVQVGAFTLRANAERLAEQAHDKGPVRIIETAQVGSTPLYRVVLGPVSNRVEADAKAQEMSTSGFLGARVLASLN